MDNHTIDAVRYGYYNYFPELFNEERKAVTLETMSWDDMIPDMSARVSLGLD